MAVSEVFVHKGETGSTVVDECVGGDQFGSITGELAGNY